MRITQSRRQFLTELSWACAGGLIGAPRAFAAEGPSETTTVRFVKIPGICNAPQYVAEELLRDEGFIDISYVGPVAAGAPAIAAVARGDADFTVTYAAPLAIWNRRRCANYGGLWGAHRLLRIVWQRKHPQHR